MKKIAALHQFLIALELFAAEQIESFIDVLNITPSGETVFSPAGICFADIEYTATFFIERYPHGIRPAELFIAQLSAWLLQDNNPRDSPVFNIDMNVDVLDAQTADIEFAIKFNEMIEAVEDPDGLIVYQDKRYSLRD